MDIKNVQALQETAIFSRQKNPGDKIDQMGFRQCLEQVTTKANMQTMGAATLSLLPEVNPMAPIFFQKRKNEISNKTSSVIDLLEKYAKLLRNPDKSLKDIEPALNSLKDEAESIYQEFAPEADETVMQILNDLRVKANVEYAKYWRGDYV